MIWFIPFRILNFITNITITNAVEDDRGGSGPPTPLHSTPYPHLILSPYPLRVFPTCFWRSGATLVTIWCHPRLWRIVHVTVVILEHMCDNIRTYVWQCNYFSYLCQRCSYAPKWWYFCMIKNAWNFKFHDIGLSIDSSCGWNSNNICLNATFLSVITIIHDHP